MKKHSTQERKVTIELPIDLTNKEVAELGEAAAELNANIKTDELEFSSIKKDWSKRIKDKKKRLDEMLCAIDEGEEKREVTCIEVRDWEAKTMTYLDCENPKKELYHRPMNEDELQMEMDSGATVTKIRKGKTLDASGEEIAEEPEATPNDFAAPQVEMSAAADREEGYF